ncbi:hypothetical protein BDFG_03944 [Blastomyces dermatitidis ATCC 26199]|nr:hypothetical protein BDFG_03944 [Blastomyces dermatitidis ATCC 26199]
MGYLPCRGVEVIFRRRSRRTSVMWGVGTYSEMPLLSGEHFQKGKHIYGHSYPYTLGIAVPLERAVGKGLQPNHRIGIKRCGKWKPKVKRDVYTALMDKTITKKRINRSRLGPNDYIHG